MLTERGKSGRLPIMLSAFVYPGAGQFMQRRWGAGLAYASIFTVLFLTLAVSVLWPLFRNLNAVLGSDFMRGAEEPLQRISVPAVLVSFTLALMAYILNLVDVTRANRRRAPPPLPPTP